jgi:hypothetical protein
MIEAKTLWHQHFGRLAYDFTALIAEYSFRFRVDEFNQPRLVDHHHGVGRGFDDLTKTALQRALRIEITDALLGLALKQGRRLGDGLRARQESTAPSERLFGLIV